MKTLFVSYMSEKTFGNCTINLEDEVSINDIQNVRELQSKIAKAENLQNVVISNMIMLPIR